MAEAFLVWAFASIIHPEIEPKWSVYPTYELCQKMNPRGAGNSPCQEHRVYIDTEPLTVHFKDLPKGEP